MQLAVERTMYVCLTAAGESCIVSETALRVNAVVGSVILNG